MLVTYFVNLNDHLFGKELFIRFTASAFRKLPSIYVFSYFPFGFEVRMWDLIVSVPDHCLSFYFANLATLNFMRHATSHCANVFKSSCWPSILLMLAAVCDCGIPWTFLSTVLIEGTVIGTKAECGTYVFWQVSYKYQEENGSE